MRNFCTRILYVYVFTLGACKNVRTPSFMVSARNDSGKSFFKDMKKYMILRSKYYHDIITSLRFFFRYPRETWLKFDDECY